MGGGESDALIPEPETIYERTRVEGKRRLSRPIVEEISTALAAGFDIVAGVVVLGLLASQLEHRFGTTSAHAISALGFGIGFVFLVVGRGELFTENFLVPLAGLDDEETSLWSLAKLWTLSPVFNILGGLVIILILSTHSVLPYGTGRALTHTAETLHANGVLALFCSAIFAGGLITAMTWFVEGQASMGPRIVAAWICGSILALGNFNHVIVATLELIFGYRYGAHYSWLFILGNFALAGAGNMLGGIGLVTVNRFAQGRAKQRASA